MQMSVQPRFDQRCSDSSHCEFYAATKEEQESIVRKYHKKAIPHVPQFRHRDDKKSKKLKPQTFEKKIKNVL